MADDDDQVPTTPDVGTPNMARMYDYALGGKDNYAVDRAAIEKLFQMSPENRDVPRANRRFLDRAVRFVAGQGIMQFLDLGAGFPSQGNVHEVAGQARPDAHVVYIDDDPVVVNHARALLATDHSTTAVVQCDLRDAGKIFADPDVGGLIDFSQPVAILFVSVLHGIPDKDRSVGHRPGFRQPDGAMAATSSCPTSPAMAIQPMLSGRRRRSSRSQTHHSYTAAVRTSCASSTASSWPNPG